MSAGLPSALAPQAFGDWALTALMLSLRVAPSLGFAPPFTLTRIPASFRLLMGLGLAGLMAAAHPAAFGAAADSAWLAQAAARELLVGVTLVLALQLMFAGLYLAGRTVDIQAGFGLATLIDPTSRAATPLVGTLLAYASGVIFFEMGGHLELVRLMAASAESIPLGTAAPPPTLAGLTGFLSAVMLVSLGVMGGAILALFLADVAIALMSRTIPQMNVLILGLQVKTILLLLVLPLNAGIWGALLARLARVTLEGIPRLLA